MLKNPNATKLMDYLRLLNANHIEMNFQIVLCKNINDGKYLEKSIRDLSEFLPTARSMSIVPFGKSKYRDGLEDIELFNREDCKKINFLLLACKDSWRDNFPPHKV